MIRDAVYLINILDVIRNTVYKSDILEMLSDLVNYLKRYFICNEKSSLLERYFMCDKKYCLQKRYYRCESSKSLFKKVMLLHVYLNLKAVSLNINLYELSFLNNKRNTHKKVSTNFYLVSTNTQEIKRCEISSKNSQEFSTSS